MKFLFSMLLALPLSVYAQVQNPAPLDKVGLNSDVSSPRAFEDQQRPAPPARPAPAPARPAPQPARPPEPARPAKPVHQQPARPAPQPARPTQPIHQPAPVHPAPGPAHHGPQPQPARNHPGPHGEWTPHQGWHAGWHRDPQWHPSWFRVGIAFPGFIWLGDIPQGYWQCTAYNQNLEGFSEMGPDQDQAAYGALYDCGGANYEAAGCYVPDGYCQAR